jgi:sodium-dependent dicarboxylate transporter 2/3/5
LPTDFLIFYGLVGCRSHLFLKPQSKGDEHGVDWIQGKGASVSEPTTSRTRVLVQWTGLCFGPVLAAITYSLLPDEFNDKAGELTVFTHAGRATLAVMVWMAVWWLTEAIDLSATALLPLVLFPLLGAAKITEAASPYAHHLIFLFMGGFLLALSMQRWGLDRRMALLTIKVVGTRPRSMVAGFMITTAVLSAFVSNTATTAMMLPIALSVIALVADRQSQRKENEISNAALSGKEKQGNENFGLCLMLGIAYAASIGGLATTIGTPPNVYLVSFVQDNYQQEISFGTWLLIGVPLTVIFLPIVWLLLTRVLYRIGTEEIEGGRELIREQLEKLGAIKAGEWVTFIVFACTVVAWILRSLVITAKPGQPIFELLAWILHGLNGNSQMADAQVSDSIKTFGAYIKDSTIAMTGAMILFVIPVNRAKRQMTMNWDVAKGLPWGILILFGGGLSLAAAVKANRVADFLGSYATAVEGMPTIVLVLAVVTAIIFLTELTSNTATTAAMVPILAALAPGLGIHPYLIIFPAALAASCAFMMPVATPPNAIVFGSGHVTIAQMCKAGFWLNLIGILLITLLSMILLGPVLGIDI